jgi:hypothetical protein
MAFPRVTFSYAHLQFAPGVLNGKATNKLPNTSGFTFPIQSTLPFRCLH